MSVDQVGQGQVNSLYVARLPESINENELFVLFNDANNPITSLRIVRNQEHKPCYGYLNFNTPEQAQAVLKQSNFKVYDNVEIVLSKNAKPTQYDPNANIYTSGALPETISAKTLHDYYSKFGDVASLQVRNKPEKTSIYVQYENVEAAQKAIEETKSLVLDDKAYDVKTEVFKPRAQREQKFTNVFVRNFPINFTEDQFRDLAGKFGKITSVFMPERFPTKPGTTSPSPTGYAFANYETPEAAQAAIAGLCAEMVAEYRLEAFPAKDKDTRKREVDSTTSQYRQGHPKSSNTRPHYQQGANNNQTRHHSRKLRIRNLPAGVDFAELSKRVQPFGAVNNVRLFAHNNSAIVEFRDPAAANTAMRALVQEWQVSFYYPRTGFGGRYPQRRFGGYGNGPRRFASRRMNMQMASQQGYYPQNGYAPQPYMMQQQGQFYQYPPQQQPPQHMQHQQPRFNTRRAQRNQNQQQAAPAPGAEAAVAVSTPLTDEERQQVGSCLYYAIQPLVNNDADLTGKITGMLLELPPNEVRTLAQDAARDLLHHKVEEARNVLSNGSQ